MGLFSFAKGIMEKNKLFQFFSWKHQSHISCQTLQMEGWATGVRTSEALMERLTGTLRREENGVRPTLLLVLWE